MTGSDERSWTRRAFVRAAGSATLVGCDRPGTPEAVRPPVAERRAPESTPPAPEASTRVAQPRAGAPQPCPEPAAPYASRRRGDARAPNIVLVTADDLGWRCLGFEGNRHVKTPAFDRLAAEGAHFPLAFGATSTCSTSRATLVTGQYASRHGVTALVHREPAVSLRKHHPTVPRTLKKLGFHTAVLGKFHISMKPAKLYGYDDNLNPKNARLYRIDDLSAAFDFVKSAAGEPFYLEVNFVDTHPRPNAKFPMDPDFPVDPEQIELPQSWALPQWPELRELAAAYFSQVMRTDRSFGQLLDGLDRLGVAEQTLVLFVSDNGAPFPGSKLSLYDRGIGTPMIVRWPGHIDAGRVIPGLASTVDLAPTMLEAAGAEPPPWVQGVSLLDRLRGDAPGPDAVFAEMHGHRYPIPSRAIRTARWKYILNFHDGPIPYGKVMRFPWAQRLVALPNQPWAGPRVPAELYDLEADPNELDNLAGREDLCDIETELRHRLHCHMLACEDPLAASVGRGCGEAAASPR